MVFGVWSSGFVVWGSGFRVQVPVFTPCPSAVGSSWGDRCETECHGGETDQRGSALPLGCPPQNRRSASSAKTQRPSLLRTKPHRPTPPRGIKPHRPTPLRTKPRPAPSGGCLAGFGLWGLGSWVQGSDQRGSALPLGCPPQTRRSASSARARALPTGYDPSEHGPWLRRENLH